jgi:hypothetical protein
MKLSALDETMLHQAPLLFEHCDTSDHRFFDRIMNTAVAPDGSAGIMMGMGVYKNMNVLDGFAILQTRSQAQHNLRFSRALRPNLEAECAPFRTEIIEPLKKRRYILEPGKDYPHAFDVTFTATLEPHLEDKHEGRIDGRMATDYYRYCQNGVLNGTATVDGEHCAVKDWYMWRDHSWGIRPNVGGFDPFTGTGGQGTFPSAIRSGGKGLMLFGFGFSTPEFGGYISLIENGLGERIYLTGHVGYPDGRNLKVVDCSYDITFVGRSRDFTRMVIRFETEDSQTFEAVNEAIGRAWIFKGAGYDGGFNDGRGMGVYRSAEPCYEYDRYDVSELGKGRLPDGSISKSSHREQHCRVTINGAPGFSYIPLIFSGDNHRYSFD